MERAGLWVGSFYVLSVFVRGKFSKMFGDVTGMSYLCRQRQWNMNEEQNNKLTYIIYCINSFADHFGLLPKQAYNYLKRYGGLAFIDECYAAEHMLSLEDAVNDMSIICKRNGGGLE